MKRVSGWVLYLAGAAACTATVMDSDSWGRADTITKTAALVLAGPLWPVGLAVGMSMEFADRVTRAIDLTA